MDVGSVVVWDSAVDVDSGDGVPVRCSASGGAVPQGTAPAGWKVRFRCSDDEAGIGKDGIRFRLKGRFLRLFTTVSEL